jgi:chaperonin GroES
MERNMAHHFRPLLDRVLAERVEAPEKTPAGVIIPDTAKEKPSEGLVLAVGTGVPNDSGTMRPLGVQPGDRVLFAQGRGMEVIIEGEDRLILRESDILGIIDVHARVSGKASTR